MQKLTPTRQTYTDLDRAYDYFNERLFRGEFPRCRVALQRAKKTYGYFSPERFGHLAQQGETVHEIALNFVHFARGAKDVLGTLMHEIAHLWRQQNGKPPRSGYHDRSWAAKMVEVGLIPIDTGHLGGEQVGQKVTYYIEKGGRFEIARDRLCSQGFALNYGNRFRDEATAKKKRASKTKCTCPDCGTNAWGKPGPQDYLRGL